MTPIEKDYYAWQGAPWGGPETDVEIVIAGEDWSAATFAWKFAAAEGSTALITLTAAALGSQGVNAQYVAEYPHPTSGALVPGGVTILRPQIDEAMLEGAPINALFTGGATEIALFHQLYITLPGGQIVERYGKLYVRKGITD